MVSGSSIKYFRIPFNLHITISFSARFTILDWKVGFLQSPQVTQLLGADLFILEESFISSHQELFP